MGGVCVCVCVCVCVLLCSEYFCVLFAKLEIGYVCVLLPFLNMLLNLYIIHQF